jgi:hypothetical protein
MDVSHRRDKERRTESKAFPVRMAKQEHVKREIREWTDCGFGWAR